MCIYIYIYIHTYIHMYRLHLPVSALPAAATGSPEIALASWISRMRFIHSSNQIPCFSNVLFVLLLVV